VKKLICFAIAVSIPALLPAPPCNWAVFNRGCNDHSTDCGFLCNGYFIGNPYACYTNASQCCECDTVYIRCACPWGPKTVYDDTRVLYEDALCNQTTSRCEFL
jgi:hypothetical protein